jgi:hypothetical protein
MFLKSMGMCSIQNNILGPCADPGCSYDRKSDPDGTGQVSPPVSPGAPPTDEPEQIPEVSSVIRLQNGMVLYLREINK